MTPGIEGKVVAITGASGGIGAATAELLAERGAKVVLGAQGGDKLNALAARIVAAGRDAVGVDIDVTKRADLTRFVEAACERFGKLDVLFNNAGIGPISPMDDLKVDEWDRMIDVNIKGVLYGIAAALPHMKAQKSGHIINVSSVAGHRVRPTSTVYSATKTAVRVISEGLRQEVTPYNIRTTIISPGAVSSELLESITEKDIAQNLSGVRDMAIPADSFASMVLFAMSQPDNVDVNEILFRPTVQEY